MSNPTCCEILAVVDVRVTLREFDAGGSWVGNCECVCLSTDFLFSDAFNVLERCCLTSCTPLSFSFLSNSSCQMTVQSDWLLKLIGCMYKIHSSLVSWEMVVLHNESYKLTQLLAVDSFVDMNIQWLLLMLRILARGWLHISNNPLFQKVCFRIHGCVEIVLWEFLGWCWNVYLTKMSLLEGVPFYQTV